MVLCSMCKCKRVCVCVLCCAYVLNCVLISVSRLFPPSWTLSASDKTLLMMWTLMHSFSHTIFMQFTWCPFVITYYFVILRVLYVTYLIVVVVLRLSIFIRCCRLYAVYCMLVVKHQWHCHCHCHRRFRRSCAN